jgi:hypothetical protein
MFALPICLKRPLTGMAIIWLACQSSLRAQEEPRGPQPNEDIRQVVLTGKIGEKAAVRAVINTTPNLEGGTSLDGTYHYLSQRKPIHLSGSLEGDQAFLEESTNRYGETVTGRFEGKWSFGEGPGQTSFQGSWTSGDGQRKLPFSLKEIREDGVASLAFYSFAEEYARKSGSDEMRREQSLSFPQLLGESDALQRVNGLIRLLALMQMEGSEENPDVKAPPPTLKALEKTVRAPLPDEEEFKDLEVSHFASLTFDESFEVMLNEKQVFCMRMAHSEYTGGAHPNHAAAHVTFDLKSGEELTLDDLLKPGWRDAVTRMAETMLRKQHGLKDGEALNGEGPLFENVFELNDNWFLTPEGLGFSFDPYEIGPYAAGFIEPIIPFPMLQDWVKPKSALERVIGK